MSFIFSLIIDYMLGCTAIGYKHAVIKNCHLFER